MTVYFIVKYLHVLGAIVILGTGTGIAFFMLTAHLSRDAAFIARTAATVVIADVLFTLSAVVLQPLSGGLLMALSAASLTERWLMASLFLYAVAGLFWIPVVSCRSKCAIWLAPPWRMTSHCRRAIMSCFAAGACSAFPGFGSVMIILWLMIAKPVF